MRIAATVLPIAFLGAFGAVHAAPDDADIAGRTPGDVSPRVERKKPNDRRPEPLVVVDAAGKVAGPYSPATSTVVLTVQDALIVAKLTNQFDVNAPYTSLGEQSGSTYRWAIAGQTWFLSADCSGPPIPLANSGLRPVAYTQDRTTGVLIAHIGGTGRSSAKPANSYREATLGGGPFSGACNQQTPFGGSIQGFGIEQTVNITQRYPEALTVQ